MKKILSKLSVGVSEFPFYSQYVKFDKESVITCNRTDLVKMNFKSDIDGYINFKVLELIYSKIDEFDSIAVEKNILKLRKNKLKYDINIESISDFPEIKDPVVANFVKLSLSDIIMLKNALHFVHSSGMFSNVLIRNGFIEATDRKKAFIAKTDIKENFVLNRKVISLLEEGSEIGKDTNGNIVIRFEDGFSSSTVDIVDEGEFPLINEHIEKFNEKARVTCKSDEFIENIELLTPTLYKEGDKIIKIKNAKKKLTLTAESSVNGISELQIDSQDKLDADILMDIGMLKNIPKDMIMKINKDNQLLLFVNDNMSIALQGWRD